MSLFVKTTPQLTLHLSDCTVTKPVDIRLAFDASRFGKIGTSSVVKAAQDLEEELLSANIDAKIGITSESCSTNGDMQLTSHLQPQSVRSNSMEGIVQRMYREGFTSENGARINSTKLAIVLVDEVPSTNLQNLIKRSKFKLDHVIVVFVGKSIDLNDMKQSLSISVDDTSEVQHVDSVSELHLILNDVKNTICS